MSDNCSPDASSALSTGSIPFPERRKTTAESMREYKEEEPGARIQELGGRLAALSKSFSSSSSKERGLMRCAIAQLLEGSRFGVH